MKQFTIYHNQRCSKSRVALKLLQDNHINPVIIEYLKNPLSLEEIIKLKKHFNLKEFVRENEPIFKSLNLNLANEDQVLEAIVKEPILMQRPIISYDDIAIIARSPEKIIELINKNK